MKNHHNITAIVLAAGFSKRMGRFKPLLPLGEYRTIERVVTLFQDVGVQVLVVTGHRAANVEEGIASLNVRCVENQAYANGMFSSVVAGIRALPGSCQAFFIHPVDIPLVRPQTVIRLVKAFVTTSADVIYPTFDGRRGHPTLIRAGLAPQILKWSGDGGLRAFLHSHDDGCLELPVADEAVLLDLDTPEDYRRLQARLACEGLPTENECRVLMDEIQALPPGIAAHCREVSQVAECLAGALKAAGVRMDVELVRTAALLHDIARTRKDHANAGAQLLKTHGYARLAPIVEVHMDLDVKERQPIDEAQVVYLADKLVAGHQRVDLELRFARRIEQYPQNSSAKAAIERKRESARCIQAKVERVTGLCIDSIVKTTAKSSRPTDEEMP